jgi:hypothetical protein
LLVNYSTLNYPTTNQRFSKWWNTIEQWIQKKNLIDFHLTSFILLISRLMRMTRIFFIRGTTSLFKKKREKSTKQKIFLKSTQYDGDFIDLIWWRENYSWKFEMILFILTINLIDHSYLCLNNLRQYFLHYKCDQFSANFVVFCYIHK